MFDIKKNLFFLEGFFDQKSCKKCHLYYEMVKNIKLEHIWQNIKRLFRVKTFIFE